MADEYEGYRQSDLTYCVDPQTNAFFPVRVTKIGRQFLDVEPLDADLAALVSPDFNGQPKNRRFIRPHLPRQARFGGWDERPVNSGRMSGAELRLLPCHYATLTNKEIKQRHADDPARWPLPTGTVGKRWFTPAKEEIAMPRSLTFDPSDGSLRIEQVDGAIGRDTPKGAVLAALDLLSHDVRDHGNGYQWLTYRGLALAGQPCVLAFCFYSEKLREVHFSVALRDEPVKGDWPSREAIDEEIAFVRQALGTAFSRSFAQGEERFSWGVAWSDFDEKAYLASSGLRYAS